DPLLRRAPHGAARPHRVGAGQIQVRQHGRRCARKTSVRPVLHQERFHWSGSADHVPDGQNRPIGQGCAIMSAIMMKMKYVFWIAAALIGYSYLGYPAWLWLRSRWSPRPVRRGFVESPAAPAVSALMVVRNEEAVIARKLENLLTLDYPQAKLDVVVVSDGSSDRTPAILADYARDSGLPDEDRTGAPSRVRTLLKPVSQGKAAGLNDAIKLASGEVLLFTDARQQIESGALRLLIENFADLDVGAASGELMLGDPISGETGKGMG